MHAAGLGELLQTALRRNRSYMAAGRSADTRTPVAVLRRSQITTFGSGSTAARDTYLRLLALGRGDEMRPQVSRCFPLSSNVWAPGA